MCYDISFSTTIELITQYVPGIQIGSEVNIHPDDNIHALAQSFRKYPIIVSSDGDYKLKMFEWGLIAEYINTPEKVRIQRSSMCNARSEKILGDKKSIWHRIRKQRCLIPVNGIFEHREVKGWKNKVPYYVSVKDRPMFCIPGLFNYSPIPDVETGELKGTFTLITRAANSIMAQIHNCGDNAFRMPLFLKKDLELQWLQPSLNDDAIAEVLGFEMPSEELDFHTVYTIRSTKPRPDGSIKTAPYSWPNLPVLGNDEPAGTQSALF